MPSKSPMLKKMMASAIILTAATFGVAACGGSDSSGEDTAPKTSASSKVAVPTSAEVDALLQKALDPKIKAKDKTDLVEGSEKDPSLFTKLVKARKANPDVKYKLQSPAPAGRNKATAVFTVTQPGQEPLEVPATLVYQDGKWKLSKSSLCQLLGFVKVESPVCP